MPGKYTTEKDLLLGWVRERFPMEILFALPPIWRDRGVHQAGEGGGKQLRSRELWMQNTQDNVYDAESRCTEFDGGWKEVV